MALRAEAAVLAGNPDARNRLPDARTITGDNLVAAAILDRAEALLTGDQDRLLATATTFTAAGCHYQVTRTMLLAGVDPTLDHFNHLKPVANR